MSNTNYAGVAVADLPHAHKSLEWKCISGSQDMGPQIQGLSSQSPSRNVSYLVNPLLIYR